MALSGVRTGLETRLNTITGLRVYKYWPGSINPPAVIIALSDGSDPHTTFASNGMHPFGLTVAVPFVDEDRAQTALDAYMDHSGASSIVAALQGDETLGGNAEYLLIGVWNVLGVAQYEGVDYLMATLPVGVHVRW